MKKKILSFILAFAFVFSVLPAGSMAVEEKSVINGNDKKEVIEVVKSFITNTFSINVENLQGLDLISKNAKDFEEYVKLRYQLNFGSKYKKTDVNLEVERKEMSFNVLEFKPKNKDIVDVKVGVIETTRYKGFDEDSKFSEQYILRLIKEDGTWKVLKAQDKSCYIERIAKPEEEIDKKGHDDFQAKFGGSFTQNNLKKHFNKNETESYLDSLKFNYNEYMRKRIEEEKILDKEAKSNNKNSVKLTMNVINRPETRAVDFNRANMRAYMNRWGTGRNPAYIDAGLYGNGDCANYASQIFRAGGAPFDYSGNMSQRWYYTGTNPGGNPGRSYSWAGVKELHNYLKNNTGGGMIGSRYWIDLYGQNLKIGEPIFLYKKHNGGNAHNPHHVVVCYQPNSDTESMLVSSHTADFVSQPLRYWNAYNNRRLAMYIN